MAIQLMKLRLVPDDELSEILDLLDAHEVDYYETSAGNWGISMPALWLRDESRYTEVRKLLDDFADDRQARIRAEYRQREKSGNSRTMFDMLRENPIRYLGALILVAGLLYLTLMPFLELLWQA